MARLKGHILVLTLVVTAFAGVFMFLPAVLLTPIRIHEVISLRRRYIGLVTGLWYDFAAVLLMYVMGSKVFLYSSAGEDVIHDTNENSMLIMCNHRTRVDWMYAGWCYAALSQLNSKLRIVLKDPLRQVPIFGWGMQIMMYIFLSRSRDNRDRDLSYVHDMLTYLLNMERAICLFIFPEGTDLSDSNKQISHKYARDHGLPVLDYVLHPRVAGLHTCLSSFKEKAEENRHSGQKGRFFVHDLTVAYKDYTEGVRTSEYSLINGECPPEVHILIDRYDIDEIPRDRTTLELWLRESFYKKERILKEFYEGGTTTNAAANGGKINPRYCTDSWPQKVNLQGAFNPLTPVVAVTAWTIFVFSSMYQFYYFRWIVVLYYFTCMVMSLRSGYGFDKLELSINGVTAPKCFKTKQEQQVQSKPSSTAGTGTAPNKNNSKTKNGSSENSRLL